LVVLEKPKAPIAKPTMRNLVPLFFFGGEVLKSLGLVETPTKN
jgi:hypothetical protein